MRKKGHLDLMGMSASSICALHCAATPLLLTTGSFGSVMWMVEPLENVLLLTSAGIALLSLLPNLLRHGKLMPLFLALLAFVLVALGQQTFGTPEIVLTAGGGLLLVIAHWMNYREIRSGTFRKVQNMQG